MGGAARGPGATGGAAVLVKAPIGVAPSMTGAGPCAGCGRRCDAGAADTDPIGEPEMGIPETGTPGGAETGSPPDGVGFVVVGEEPAPDADPAPARGGDPATAPSATGSSGCSRTVGAMPVSACRRRLTSGTRLVPPTRKMPLRPLACRPACRRAAARYPVARRSSGV